VTGVAPSHAGVEYVVARALPYMISHVVLVTAPGPLETVRPVDVAVA
jgi:hypothetical protein